MLGYKREGCFLVILLEREGTFNYFLRISKPKRSFAGVRHSYLNHIAKSSVPLVRDFYILHTCEGFLSYEETLSRGLGGQLVFQISFFDRRQLAMGNSFS